MKFKILALISVFSLCLNFLSKADEGMWLPMLISKYNIYYLQQAGLKLTAEQIYSVNQSCLKDAVITLDHGGCTGSIISAKGLLITNHHCGFEDIASQSTIDHDYLTEGFWAMRPEEELPIPGKSVSFLVRMEDVTADVLAGVRSDMSIAERNEVIERTIDSLTSLAIKGTTYEADIESMFEGNEYYLFIYETFKDIRMVGAPPSGIGKFGGETDNWMWPRHTGDFCLLRVYSDASGKPAQYSKDNVPYTAKYFLPVSMKGIKEGDFSMILGYPGSTDRYLTSYGIKQKLDQLNPADIVLKTAKMEIIMDYMKQGDAQRIAYASDYAYLANFQKKSIQESKALQRLKVYDDKKKQEEEFEAWVNQDERRQKTYGKVLKDLQEVYASKEKEYEDVAQMYLEETITGAKVLYWAYQVNDFVNMVEEMKNDPNSTALLREKAGEFYKGFRPEVDKKIMARLLTLYKQNVPFQYFPDFFKKVDKKYKGDFARFADHLFSKSFLADKDRFDNFLKNPSSKRLRKDPVFQATTSMLTSYFLTRAVQMSYTDKFNETRRLYIRGLQEMNPMKGYYPDANSTMRLTYGKVEPYNPADAVEYKYFTTSEGILQKEDPSNPEFKAPEKLLQLLKNKDFGNYGVNGELPVCFLTTLDITGGNSGSPVMNAYGELIGVAFDGNSEAMSSDIKYDADLQRTICVDIRYVLFIIDKFAGAGYLLDEMKLARN